MRLTSKSNTPQPAPRSRELNVSSHILGTTRNPSPAVSSTELTKTDLFAPSLCITFPPSAEKMAPDNTSADIGTAASMAGDNPCTDIFSEIFIA